MDNIKRLAGCVNNKEVYLTVLKAHALAGHLSYLQGLEKNLRDTAADEDDAEGEEDPPTGVFSMISYMISWCDTILPFLELCDVAKKA